MSLCGLFLKKRDQYQTCCTRFFNIVNFFLGLFALGWLVVISMFIGKGSFNFEYQVDRIHEFGVTFAFLGIIILMVILLLGHYLNNQRKPDTRVIVFYACFVMIFGIIPFFGEAGLLHMFHSMDESNVD